MIEVSEQGAQVLGKIAVVLAHGEGLQAHAQVAEMRLICDCVAIENNVNSALQRTLISQP